MNQRAPYTINIREYMYTEQYLKWKARYITLVTLRLSESLS